MNRRSLAVSIALFVCILLQGALLLATNMQLRAANARTERALRVGEDAIKTSAWIERQRDEAIQLAKQCLGR